MTVVNRIDDSICAGRKSGAMDSDNARPKAEEIASKGAKE
jgi:hypothetical protein